MTVSAPTRSARRHRPPASGEPARPGALAVTRLPLRLTRRGAGLLCLTLVVYLAIEVASYVHTYPDEAARRQLLEFTDTGAIRTLQGEPQAVDTVGGFVVWDAGWFLALIVGIWALLLTTRLLRAEEDTGRAELVLVRDVTPVRVLAGQLAVVALALGALAVVGTVTQVALGLPLSGAALFATGLAGVGATSAGVAAVTAQLFDVRRRAVGAAGAVLGLAFVLRMIGNSADGREWLLWTTPFGWLDRLDPFAGDRWERLLPFVAVPALLAAVAVRERVARDLGAARLGGHDRHPPRLHLLGSAAAFGWRATNGTLLAWALGSAVFGVVLGALVTSVTDLLDSDAYRETLQDFGFDVSAPVDGFLAVMAVSMALVLALFISWRIGALRAEEAADRLEHLLVRPVSREKWLAESAGLALVAATLVALACGAGLWVGAAATGADVDVGQALVPLLATLPVVALFGGLAVLAFGAAPRLTVGLPVTVAVATYLLDFLGPSLGLPQAVLDLSPFGWLPRPPLEPFAVGPAAVLGVVAVVAAAAGIALFERRDVQGE